MSRPSQGPGASVRNAVASRMIATGDSAVLRRRPQPKELEYPMNDVASTNAVLPAAEAPRPNVLSKQTMNDFFRIAEVWVPTKDRLQLQLGDGLYGTLGEVRTIS